MDASRKEGTMRWRNEIASLLNHGWILHALLVLEALPCSSLEIPKINQSSCECMVVDPVRVNKKRCVASIVMFDAAKRSYLDVLSP